MTTATDVLAEMKREVRDYLAAHNPLVFSEAAAAIIAGNPELVDNWLQTRKLQLLTDYISGENRSIRARQPVERLRTAFAEYREEHETALASDGAEAARERTGWYFAKLSVTDADGRSVQQELRTLNARQVSEARDGYRRRAKENAFYAAKLEAVRRRVAASGPEAVVSDVFTPEEINNMFEREQR